MKNLKLFSGGSAKSDCLKNVSHMFMCEDTGVSYFIGDEKVHKLLPRASKPDGVIEVGVWRQKSEGRVINATYVWGIQSLCILSSSGEISSVYVDSDQILSVADNVVASGIACGSWSPDQELLLLITDSSQLFLLTCDFQPFLQRNLHQDDFGSSKPVNVGWGKKETQFHGSLGKEAARQKDTETSSILAWDDRKTRISWREDGSMFVVSCVHPQNDERKLLVFDREGTLLSTGEAVAGIEQGINWRPSGNLITTSQHSNKHKIIFFEKNGLRHGEFILPFESKSMKVIEVMWNIESSVLLVWCEDMNRDFAILQLWTTSNYHWYLKQSLRYSGEALPSCVQWDANEFLKLHVVLRDGSYTEYIWNWTVTCEEANVAVIDGRTALITPFRDIVVPPPMCGYTIQVPDQVQELVFLRNQAMVVTHSKLYFFGDATGCEEISGGCSVKESFTLPNTVGVPGLMNVCDINVIKATNAAILHHWFWIHESQVACLEETKKDVVHLVVAVVEGPSCSVLKKFSLAAGLRCTAISPAHDIIFFQFANNIQHKYNVSKMSVEDVQSISYKKMAFGTNSKNELEEVGLTVTEQLYVGGNEIESGVTSFRVHSSFVVYTTRNHTIKCVPICKDEENTAAGLMTRKMERGGTLVALDPHSTLVVLQMPRGNLEVIHPRALVLHTVARALNRSPPDYNSAYQLMRKHRINLNLLHDHAPAMFRRYHAEFVSQLSTDALSQFISDLTNEDTRLTFYCNFYKVIQLEREEKVEQVCNLLRNSMKSQGAGKYFIPIITSFLKKEVSSVDEALKWIMNLKNNSSEYVEAPSVDEALKYVMLMVDANELFDVALGTYDFELVMMVAEKSKKDPKEYLPLLNELNTLEGNYQKFRIDVHLRRYREALVHLVSCGEEHTGELVEFVKQHNVYAEALNMLAPNTNQYQVTSLAFGHKLFGDGNYEEAGLVFFQAKIYDKALEAFQSAILPNQIMLCLDYLQADEMKRNAVYEHVAERAASRGHYSAAAFFYERMKKIDIAIEVLLEAHAFSAAMQTSLLNGRTDLISSCICNRITHHHTQLLSSINKNKETFRLRLDRLLVLREKMETQDGEEGGGLDSDMFSDSSSTTASSASRGSSSSRRSNRSAKNRRKLERKKHSLKEGSQYEDLALIEALHGIVSHAATLIDEVHELSQNLVTLSKIEEARNLQNALCGFLKDVRSKIRQIWPPDTATSDEPLAYGPQITSAALVLASQEKAKITRYRERMMLLEPVFRYPPSLRLDDGWTLKFLHVT